MRVFARCGWIGQSLQTNGSANHAGDEREQLQLHGNSKPFVETVSIAAQDDLPAGFSIGIGLPIAICFHVRIVQFELFTLFHFLFGAAFIDFEICIFLIFVLVAEIGRIAGHGDRVTDDWIVFNAEILGELLAVDGEHDSIGAGSDRSCAASTATESAAATTTATSNNRLLLPTGWIGRLFSTGGLFLLRLLGGIVRRGRLGIGAPRRDCAVRPRQRWRLDRDHQRQPARKIPGDTMQPGLRMSRKFAKRRGR